MLELDCVRNMAAYLAGIADNYGCIRFDQGSPLIRLDVRKKRRMLEKFSREFGGSVFKNGAGWRWQATGSRAQHALMRMRPYMEGRGAVVDALLAWVPKYGQRSSFVKRKKQATREFRLDDAPFTVTRASTR